MILKELKPRKALNKAFLKVKPNRSEIESFKTNLSQLLERVNDSESEEFHKNLVSDFLKKTWYDPNHFINTKGRNDLVIHNGNSANSSVGVIIEAKKPTNKAEMLTKDNLNVKAFQELVLYYLRERITQKNIEIKHLIATNINEWFIFDATLFDRLFAQNKNLVKQFNDFEGGRLADTKTDFFYKHVAEPFIAEIKHDIECTYFDIREYEKPLRNADKKDDNQLIALFKLLSPQHLLKLPFANDSNSLDKRFYGELLHIIGLTETKDGSKKLIERNKEGERNAGSLLENAIIQLDSLDKISQLQNPGQFGANLQERLFNVALELSITWINRILFLKLLEAQLISYHKGDKSYEFLSFDKIKDYDDLNSLFFQVLARKQNERNEDVKTLFAKVPYLNSSLFEPTDIEHTTLFISNLRNDKTLSIYSQTVLKDSTGKKRTGNINPLQYLFEFLDAYDFTSEGSEEIQEDNKTLINASVLGLIFEKINGYKDGSFFTPGFITMYMCRETIRKAVVQKFNEVKGWNCTDIDSLYDKIEDRNEANKIINDLKICDPAVGSGHFLVSALNEIIAIKSDLKILQDREGKRLKEYHVEVVNDELVVTDEDGELFEYNPANKESQRVQETLFHEKQTIIENCLFGVDLNPNSVKICRLRLWIELLKNAYYKSSPPFQGGVPEGGGGYSIHNLPHLKTFRKELRNNLTPAEAALWTMLKGKALEGRKFRRQHSVGNYILDFYCPEEQLAVELDGQGHFEANQAEYDYERDLFLKHFGIKVLRFENNWVWDNQEGILQAIRNEFGKQKPPRPADTPPYKGGVLRELETLPNIDINIKCGNSLISRFALDADLKQALKKSASKWTIDSYRLAVDTYRNAQSKEQKREMERLINEIKTNFRSEISQNDPKVKRLRALQRELFSMTNQGQLFELSKKEKADWNAKVAKLTAESQKLEAEIEQIKSNKIYENAFEWRFEFPEVLDDNGDFVGFDVVMGNPPYIRQEEFSEIKPYLKSKFEIYHSIADLLTYFVELGYTLLKEKGTFQFIISNKFTRANYGQVMRQFLLNKTSLTHFLDFSGIPVFDEATVDAAIIGFRKMVVKPNKFVYANIPKENLDVLAFDDFLNSIKTDFAQESLSSNVWAFENPKVLEIKRKVEAQGIALKDWDITINYGIKTGLNEAFVIDGKKKDEFIAQDPKSAEILKPLLRGRDIQKWKADFQDLWLIATFPSKAYNIDDYPVIKNHLLSFGKAIEQSGEKGARKKTSNKWFETQDNIAYWADFEKPKIIYPNMTKFLPFVIDLEGEFYHNDKSFHLVCDRIYWLGAFLNSKLFDYCFRDNFPELLGGTRELRKVFFDKIPVKQISEAAEQPFKDLVMKILELKKQDPTADTTALETEIDRLVYELYGLTEEEIKIIENA